MQQIPGALILCGWQVTAVALFGLVASWISMRMRPALAPSLACSTMVVIVALSLAAPFPMPTWLAFETSPETSPRGQTLFSVLSSNARSV